MKTNRILAVAAAALISISSFAQSADEIVNKHFEAIGGKEKMGAVKTIVTDISLSIQGQEIPVKSHLVLGKSVRSESTIMGNAMIQVLDGPGGWMIRPAMMGGTGDPENLSPEVLKQLQGQLDPFGPLNNYQEKGNKVELIGKEKVDKKDVYHLKVTTKEGVVMDQYLDANTYMVAKTTVYVNGQGMDVLYSDYKNVDGIKIAHLTEMTGPMGAMAFITNKVKINTPVDESVFKRPK